MELRWNYGVIMVEVRWNYGVPWCVCPMGLVSHVARVSRLERVSHQHESWRHGLLFHGARVPWGYGSGDGYRSRCIHSLFRCFYIALFRGVSISRCLDVSMSQLRDVSISRFLNFYHHVILSFAQSLILLFSHSRIISFSPSSSLRPCSRYNVPILMPSIDGSHSYSRRTYMRRCRPWATALP